jgi:hypothetical protein
MRHKRILRITCLLLTSLLLFNQVFYAQASEPTLWAERHNAGRANAPSASTFATAPETFPPLDLNGQSKLILYIEDIHGNRAAQRDIAGKVRTLIRQRDAQLIALEGAFDRIDLSWYQRYPYHASVRAAADYFFRTSRISGPIHAALTSTFDAPALVGIDDRALYAANVRTYRNASRNTTVAATEIRAIRQRLNEAKRRIFSSALLEFDRHIESYRDGRSSLTQYIGVLAEYNPETPRLLQAIFQKHRVPSDDTLARSINDELLRIEAAVYDRLSQTALERTLVRKSRRLFLQSKLVSFTLSRKEWDEYLTLKRAASAGDVLPTGLIAFESFYECAERRDRAMAENLANAFKKTNARVAVLVAGGFHRAGMTEILRARGFRVVSIVPRFTVNTALRSPDFSSFQPSTTAADLFFKGPNHFLAPNPMMSETGGRGVVVLHSEALGKDLGRIDTSGGSVVIDALAKTDTGARGLVNGTPIVETVAPATGEIDSVVVGKSFSIDTSALDALLRSHWFLNSPFQDLRLAKRRAAEAVGRCIQQIRDFQKWGHPAPISIFVLNASKNIDVWAANLNAISTAMAAYARMRSRVADSISKGELEERVRRTAILLLDPAGIVATGEFQRRATRIPKEAIKGVLYSDRLPQELKNELDRWNRSLNFFFDPTTELTGLLLGLPWQNDHLLAVVRLWTTEDHVNAAEAAFDTLHHGLRTEPIKPILKYSAPATIIGPAPWKKRPAVFDRGSVNQPSLLSPVPISAQKNRWFSLPSLRLTTLLIRGFLEDSALRYVVTRVVLSQGTWAISPHLSVVVFAILFATLFHPRILRPGGKPESGPLWFQRGVLFGLSLGLGELGIALERPGSPWFEEALLFGLLGGLHGTYSLFASYSRHAGKFWLPMAAAFFTDDYIIPEFHNKLDIAEEIRRNYLLLWKGHPDNDDDMLQKIASGERKQWRDRLFTSLTKAELKKLQTFVQEITADTAAVENGKYRLWGNLSDAETSLVYRALHADNISEYRREFIANVMFLLNFPLIRKHALVQSRKSRLKFHPIFPDVVDAILRQAIPQWDPERSQLSYFLTKFTTFEVLRIAAKRPRRHGFTMSLEKYGDPVDKHSSPNEDIVELREVLALWQHMGERRKELAAIVQLHLEGLTYEEIAEVLSARGHATVSKASISRSFNLALEMLRERFLSDTAHRGYVFTTPNFEAPAFPRSESPAPTNVTAPPLLPTEKTDDIAKKPDPVATQTPPEFPSPFRRTGFAADERPIFHRKRSANVEIVPPAVIVPELRQRKRLTREEQKWERLWVAIWNLSRVLITGGTPRLNSLNLLIGEAIPDLEKRHVKALSSALQTLARTNSYSEVAAMIEDFYLKEKSMREITRDKIEPGTRVMNYQRFHENLLISGLETLLKQLVTTGVLKSKMLPQPRIDRRKTPSKKPLSLAFPLIGMAVISPSTWMPVLMAWITIGVAIAAAARLAQFVRQMTSRVLLTRDIPEPSSPIKSISSPRTVHRLRTLWRDEKEYLAAA